MPVCPNCEAEYIEGVEVCPDCGYDLLENQEYEEHMVNPEDWDTVYTSSEEYEAQMLKANLEGAGIEALIIDQKDRNFPAVGDLAKVKLVVQKKDYESAKQIIDDINLNKSQSEDIV